MSPVRDFKTESAIKVTADLVCVMATFVFHRNSAHPWVAGPMGFASRYLKQIFITKIMMHLSFTYVGKRVGGVVQW
jgi:hypothetical protein